MKTFEEIRALLREKSGKKLAAFSVIIFVLITAIVFFATFKLCENIQLQMMGEYLWEIPEIVESYREDLLVHGRVYEDDALSRAELGLMVYKNENTLTEEEKLEHVRAAVSSASVSVLDGQGKLLFTTGPVSPEETFHACIQNLEPRQAHLELYPTLSADGTEPDKSEGKLFVRLPITGNAEQSLVFEFSCDKLLELYNVLDDWAYMLEHVLSGGEVAAYAKTGDKLEEYSLDGPTIDKDSQLYEELTKVFQNADSFRDTKDGSASKFITLLGKRYLAVLTQYPQEDQEDTEILLTLALKSVIRNGVYIATAISAIMGLGIILIQIYVFRRLMREKAEKGKDSFSGKEAIRATWLGILAVFAVTFLFTYMLLLLESRTNVALTTMTKRMQLESKIGWHKDEGRTMRDIFEEVYRARAQMLADFLKEHPDCQTRAGLKELSLIAKTDYLMLFDSAGQERLSSNSYTGFSVGENMSQEYQAVLLGYPYAVVGPTADPYTGAKQLGAAILMTDSEGRPKGFLLAVYGTRDMNAALERTSYENTVSSQVVREGYIAAAIDDKSGTFIAHTSPKMIGQKAADFLEGYEPGSHFEGFLEYNGKIMCASANAADGKTLLFMVPEREDSFARAIYSPLFLAAMLLLALVYYPAACGLEARAMREAKDKLPPEAARSKPMAVFIDGYSTFLVLFALFVSIASANGWWTSFDYVLGGGWTHGVHLFSVWAALFVLAITCCCLFLIRTVLNSLESRLSLQARTVTRLVRSLITYAACFFLIFYILGIFGVNTTTVLASAGIVSIAAGMGAQSMAADLLAGFFMMLEGSVHVGDRVNVGGVTGRVTDMGIRTTEITDDEGTVIIINNSKVSPVRNMSRKQLQKEQKNEPKNE